MPHLSKSKLGALGAVAGIAAALIGQGIIAWNAGDQFTGAVFLTIGGVLFIIDYLFLA
jgi:hypothetical protein